MSIFAIIILSTLFIAMFVIAARLLWALSTNVKTGQLVREQIAKRIDQFRYGKMLAMRGVNRTRFLHEVPLTEIEQQMNQCQGCNATKQCDDALQQNMVNEQELSFCPNTSEISKHI